MKRIARNSKGFSLPELLVIMFVISALAAGTYTLMQIIRMKGQVTKCLKDTREIAAAMSTFNDDTGAWPCSGAGILELSGASFTGYPAALPNPETNNEDELSYPRTGLTDRGSATHGADCTDNYANIPNGSWGGPYLQLTEDQDSLPVNPWKGRYFTYYNCVNNQTSAQSPMTGMAVGGCEYGIIITNIPNKAARELARKVSGSSQTNSNQGDRLSVFVAGDNVTQQLAASGVQLGPGIGATPGHTNGYLFVGEE